MDDWRRAAGEVDTKQSARELPPASAVQGGMPRLLVFLHLALKQRALQGELQDALRGMAVTTVGRVADFDRALEEGQDAILTLPPVLEARSITAKLQGIRHGAADEPYALVAESAQPDASAVASLGALDLLGREGTQQFVHSLLGRAVKVERVSKVEDLLPLLQMQRVNAILVARRLVDELRAMSRMSLAERELPKRVGLPTAATVGPLGAQALAALSNLPSNAFKLLGVDEWR